MFRTDGGKFVAALMHEHDFGSGVDYDGAVANDAAGIADFFTRQVTAGAGKSRVTRSHLNEAGKRAMQVASEKDQSFREKGFEEVD